ncbi:peptidoglycan/xylan/chitin deacetylase (PgdA/CDA1 family) [Kibdelosporangium banguiense]|uniref:Peptidoglycan/xylan/chitin deacetylase (PgdA/CDA1 family) n=1 Tax=Kibdelosporangium banguiense TaxID=1365924 RepID=A0ABS4TPM2_9PSEU|nr:polysaccharide deacetylase family protein [Kibdelosporangium banguiense]MBP2326352.1 peptidoglycan/xylan/chitin deacetylase (PgdA/CDA1 family) [Kibdelosporangium banguiense]
MRVLPSSRRARKWTIISLVALVVLVASLFGLQALSSARTFQFFGGLTDRVDTSQKVVALTFDDGPDPAGAQQLLDALAKAQVPATFYLIGRDMAEYPDLARDLVKAGHELGNHTYSHERMVFVTPGFVAGEVERTDELIRRAGYQGEITFRPPNGKKLLALPYYLDEHNRKTIMWDVEPNSYPDVDASAERIVDFTVQRVRPGSIILLHGMYAAREQSRLAVTPIIDRLKADGYRFVTVSELLTYQGK